MDTPRITPVADRAILVVFADDITEAAHEAVLRLDAALQDSAAPGIVETVPAFVSLLIVFDPIRTDHNAVAGLVRASLSRPAARTASPQIHDIAVCYDGDLAPDLDDVARLAGMSRDAAIAAHLAGDYSIFMYGFAPGYAYMAGVPESLRLDRKQSARRGVPAGSVLIAGPQCLVSTLTMPTGWWVIGRSDATILRDDPERQFLFDVGDRVRFRRVRRDELKGPANG
ncbi:allophanate hydrolase subunit 1 [Paracoccus sp. TK19116]|uniref:Allophanate hydrolase subunit 1 n=1 Tax=Paracoccus albicereus TaxID=2922394 RepID=A0ABT1MNF8_9RHOB|nr:allophanate hydrolase subunit 1 [Paracoccus albicereus]